MSATSVYRNADIGGFIEDAGAQDIGASFSGERLQLADMNGDGLNDPVELFSGGTLRYWLNLGWGQWSAQKTISNLPLAILTWRRSTSSSRT